MTIDLYYSPSGSSCRIVLLAAKSLDVELNLIPVDIMNPESFTPEFIKLNPQHCVPTLNDSGFVIWESKAIITYLQNQYGKNDDLYPKDPKKRATVDQRLFFDTDLYARFHEVYTPKTFAGLPPDPEALANANKALDFLDEFLVKSEYVAGDSLTLADLSLVVQISNLELLGHDMSPYKYINRWYAKVKAIAPGYKEANEDNLVYVKQLMGHFAQADE
ncbi:glutathione S-transferase 1-1 [Anoplophora glabripennis]|uniref:glutathione S-transferase 1-1 n=1 Tax=Anoplophora glabripennis TaxID=217634 RepID=UPI0008737B40|nr:glutathione S-transferase 1-1 [Anoplophora glabripennis]